MIKNKQDLGIAVIGSGYWGKNLVRNFYSIGALRLICDKDEATTAQFKGQYPDIDICMSLSDVLKRDDIHGVVIATPAETHFTIAMEVLLAGKHVYVEKPLVLDEAEGEKLIRLGKKKNLIIMVGHLLQYHPVFVELKRISLEGELGKINYIYSHRLNLGKIRREENILWSFAPHDISMILSLAGEMPNCITTVGANYLHQKIADVTVTHLEFNTGMKAHIFVSWLHPFKEQKLVVVGDKKMAVFDDTLPWEEKLQLYAHEIKWINNVPQPDKAEPERINIPKDEPLRKECEQFLSSIRSGERPITDGREGVNVLRVLKTSQRSLDNIGRRIYLDRTDAATGEDRDLQDKSFIHPTAVIDDMCEIGNNSKIWHFSHVLKNTKIGESCNIGQNVVVGPDVTIGKKCKIQNNVSVYKGVTLEDGVFCGPSMVFTNINNPRAEISKMEQVRNTLVKKGATIGANATIVCGVTLGRYCFIGAGAVVNRNVKDHELVVGNPVKQIGWVCHCGERLNDDLSCSTCNHVYVESDLGLKRKI